MTKQTPYSCTECNHYISGAECQAFDIIPIELYGDAKKHSKIIENQKGDFIFSTDIPPHIMYIYPPMR